jgi:hypothetical protein
LLFADGTNAHLEGGGGPTIEVGGGGDSTHLEGGLGRNLLIAGPGRAHLEGRRNDDILIGGYTDYDNNEAALLALMAEWTSSANYPTRVAHILGTSAGGLNGSFVLNHSTVHDNGVEDQLDSGGGRDLFFARLSQDIIPGPRDFEIVENL